MRKIIGIRREDKNRWEGRTPLIPEDIRELIRNDRIDVVIQPSDIREHKEDEFIAAGASVSEEINHSNIILGIKEMPEGFFRRGGTYLFFSHTIKGQPYNISMLKRMMELECNLLDYECIKDEYGRRLIAFGRFAGLAGIVDTLWAYGRRLEQMGVNSPLSEIRQTIDYTPAEEENSDRYPKLSLIRREFQALGEKIKKHGLPKEISPFIIGIAGYGNVSSGVQELLDILPVRTIEPNDIDGLLKSQPADNKTIYKIVFKEKDMVERIDKMGFELLDYYNNPQFYRSVMNRYIPKLNILINSIFWTDKYPRILSIKDAKAIFAKKDCRLLAIGDISVDIKGAVELSVRASNIGNPVYIYDIKKDKVENSFHGNGPLILAVDNLPCEFPRDSSSYFSHILKGFIKELALADFNHDFEKLELPVSLKNAVILHKGKLTENFDYMKKYL